MHAAAPPRDQALTDPDLPRLRDAADAMEGHVDTHGFRLYVREMGSGAPLLLINGLGGNVEMWAVAQRLLARQAHTIAFDAPGTGRSKPSPVPLPAPALAWLITKLLDHLGHDRVDVIGYSLGGTVAQQLAHSRPNRVRRLALVGTSCGWGSAPPEALPMALIATPLRYFSPSFYRRTNHLLDGGDRFREAALSRAQATARNRHPPSLIGYAQQLVQGTTWSSLHWARSLAVPTLVLSGDRDRLVPPANGALLASLIPQSRLHVLPGEGHLMLFDPDSAAHGLLSDFFAASEVEESGAWRTGAQITEPDVAHARLKATPGAQPFRALSAAYRSWVRLITG